MSQQDLAILNQLFIATSEQVLYTYRPELKETATEKIEIESFQLYKETMSEESKLIVEQLRLIAFTALDIQVLLQTIERRAQNELPTST